VASSQVIDLAATRAASATRTGGPKTPPRRNRVLAFFTGMLDVLQEARELERRTLGAGRHRRFGES
jgi:hypothetical protein